MVNAYSGGALGHVGIALAFAFVVTAMIYALGHISGAHINPAVTLAFASANRFPRKDVLPYVLAQCIGAVAASVLARLALGPVGGMGATVPAPSLSTGAAFGVEWVLSFGLMLVVMAVATDERVAGGFAGIAVGLTVGFEAMAGGPLTGASMNPARSLRPRRGWGWLDGALVVLGCTSHRNDRGGVAVRVDAPRSSAENCAKGRPARAGGPDHGELRFATRAGRARGISDGVNG